MPRSCSGRIAERRFYFCMKDKKNTGGFLLSGAPETAAGILFHLGQLLELRSFYGHDESLRDALAPLHGHRLIGEIADQKMDLVLRPVIILVDHPDAVRHGQTLFLAGTRAVGQNE